MTNELMIDIFRLRDANMRLTGKINRALLESHPESDVDAIKLKLDADLSHRLGESPARSKRNEIALLERTRANLRERAQALIKLHPDVAGLFEGLL